MTEETVDPKAEYDQRLLKAYKAATSNYSASADVVRDLMDVHNEEFHPRYTNFRCPSCVQATVSAVSGYLREKGLL